MGVKVGQFGSKNGHTYEVRLSGNSVESGEILLGVPPVTISMAAGEHKFCGFKSTTAIVNILTDAPLLDLYSESVTGIRFTIEDVTVGTIEFDGYVTPFAFDQPFTGRLDLVTVNAVDLISVRKDVKYENIGPDHGTDRSALTIVQEICKRAGVNTIYLHLNFNDTNDMMKDASPLDVMVAQAGFLQDEVSDADALSAICKFFGYTGHVIGRSLYLYDEYLLADWSDVNIYSLYESGWAKVSHSYKDPNSVYRPQSISSIHNGISVSVERAYDGIQITPEGSDTSILLPDVLSDDNIEDIAEAEELHVSIDNGVEYRQRKGSKLLDYGSPNISGTPSKIDDTYLVENSWNNAAVLYQSRDSEKVELIDNIIAWIDKSPVNVLWVRKKPVIGDRTLYIAGRQKDSTCFSHTRGYVKLNIEYVWSNDDDWKGDVPTINFDNLQIFRFLRILCGDSVFNTDPTPYVSVSRWITGDVGSSFYYKDKLLATGVAQSFRKDELLIEIPSDGRIRVDVGWSDSSPTYFNPSNLFIKKLSLEGWGEDVDTSCAHMRHSFAGSTHEMLDVKLSLTSRSATMGRMAGDYGMPNARPGVVTDADWAAPYAGGTGKKIPISGILMTQLKARYDKPYAAYKMTVDGNIKPYAGVIFNDKTYTVEAYDRDIYNDTTTITID